ncbi:hypothetical protein HMPREF9134_01426 [Porphyromonas catoniae F0037]|uniref:Uncharacterized protein n=1 Tax=Porphyromonas catoniae F0037 TaxID=1127696 RepID=L1NBD6_9PORP|nr:hypothetical protein HMPREF9134_01426 [Porphyromonas catoniae F0037]
MLFSFAHVDLPSTASLMSHWRYSFVVCWMLCTFGEEEILARHTQPV